MGGRGEGGGGLGWGVSFRCIRADRYTVQYSLQSISGGGGGGGDYLDNHHIK